jgi:PIN domain nuclease of toxin-antitoxin system
MAVVELQYLYEIRRIVVSPQAILVKLNAEVGLTVCDYPFPIIAEIALGEGWTRDPFDRIIVAHAKANGLAPLLTKDELILENYSNARW